MRASLLLLGLLTGCVPCGGDGARGSDGVCYPWVGDVIVDTDDAPDPNPDTDPGDTDAGDTDGGDTDGGDTDEIRTEDCDVECALVAVGSDACPVTITTTPDPWNVVEAWRWHGPTDEIYESATSPAVARIRDDDGDGDVDADDRTYVVVVAMDWFDATLAALDATTGEVLWTLEGVFPFHNNVVVADVDTDGWPEILVYDESEHLIAVSGDGEIEWTSGAPPAGEVGEALLRAVVVADLDADGAVEVIADTLVLNGADGSLRATLSVDKARDREPVPVVGDVDLDGDQDILLSGRLFEPDGTLVWEVPEVPWLTVAAALVQADCDAEAEIAFVGQDVALYDHDATLIWRRTSTTPDDLTGMPCVGDVDGDGAPEIIRPHATTLEAWTLGGTLLWEAPISDLSSAAGCSAWDLDGDGALEVLLADEIAFRILDGRTGAELYVDPTHRSATGREVPVVSDLDGDGSAEIVTANTRLVVTEMIDAIVVYTHAGAGWSAGADWPIYDFSITNVPAANGAVPASPRPPWLDESVTRAGPDTLAGGVPDLRAEVVSGCFEECGSESVEVHVRVENRGTAHTGRDVPVALYASDGSDLRLVGVQTVPPIRRGWALDAITFSVPVDGVGTAGFVAIADDDGSGVGTVEECDQHADAVRWDGVCP